MILKYTKQYFSMKALASGCTKCSLCQSRNQVVFGYGNIRSTTMLVGRDPGATEDQIGIPFCGDAGKRLEVAIRKAGFKIEDFWITNIALCHTPNNRGPTQEEMEACFGWFEKQFQMVQPNKLLLFGKEVVEHLLGLTGPISQLSGRVFYDAGLKVHLFPLFHPSYVLRARNNRNLQERFDREVEKALKCSF